MWELFTIKDMTSSNFFFPWLERWMWFSYSHERYLKSIDGGNLLQLIEKARLQIIFLTFVPLGGSINVRACKIEKKKEAISTSVTTS